MWPKLNLKVDLKVRYPHKLNLDLTGVGNININRKKDSNYSGYWIKAFPFIFFLFA